MKFILENLIAKKKFWVSNGKKFHYPVNFPLAFSNTFQCFNSIEYNTNFINLGKKSMF